MRRLYDSNMPDGLSPLVWIPEGSRYKRAFISQTLRICLWTHSWFCSSALLCRYSGYESSNNSYKRPRPMFVPFSLHHLLATHPPSHRPHQRNHPHPLYLPPRTGPFTSLAPFSAGLLALGAYTIPTTHLPETRGGCTCGPGRVWLTQVQFTWTSVPCDVQLPGKQARVRPLQKLVSHQEERLSSGPPSI